MKQLIILLLALCLSSCGFFSKQDSLGNRHFSDKDISKVADAKPKQEPKSRYGNPPSYVVFGRRYHVMKSADGYHERGIASWYGKKFHGRRTSNGETYDMYQMTAAHKTLPLPSYVQVTNIKNNKQIIVRVNDRGPFHQNRIIDLSYVAARKLDIVKYGIALVDVKVIGTNDQASAQPYQKPKSSDNFYIQVGAFQHYGNAIEFKQKLHFLDDDIVIIQSTVIQGKRIHRVRIGAFSQVEQADDIVDQLSRHDIYDHHIVFD